MKRRINQIRNYVKELHDRGYTYKQLASELRVSRWTVSRLARGIKPLPKSEHPFYEIIRNTSRRLSYQEARSWNLSPAIASVVRRSLLNPQPKPRYKEVLRRVKTKQAKTLWQLNIIAEFQHSVTKQKIIAEGWSYSYLEQNYLRQLTEAVDDVRGKREDSNWNLIKVISFIYYKFELL
ncbi:MAG: hypothetical protein DDT29_01178 [Dehalococcoidia bacterium]|nr:hypothetical protein [Bacillota bacterium]